MQLISSSYFKMIAFAVNEFSHKIIFYPCYRKAKLFSFEFFLHRAKAVNADTRQAIASECMWFIHFLKGKQPQPKAVYIENTVNVTLFGDFLLEKVLVKIYGSVHVFDAKIERINVKFHCITLIYTIKT
jgi:hypothetical protein